MLQFLRHLVESLFELHKGRDLGDPAVQMQTRLVTGDIIRVYRGVDLTYSGWQRSSFCAPESLFQDLDFPFPGFKPVSLKSSLTPQESLEYVKENVRRICGDVPEKLLSKLLE